MFELVHTYGNKEKPYARRENLLDAKLLQQMHIRSIAHGTVEVREVKANKTTQK